MAGLPYAPFPQEEPSGQAAPMQGLDTPGEAFGAGIADSAGKFGATLEDIGQRQAAQALKFQEMKNETWANETVTSFGNELADAQEQFRELQGLNRVNALPEYQKRVDEIHQKYAQGAPSPMARLNFLTQSRGFVLRAHESFGTLAGTAADEAHNQAAEGAIKTAQASAVQNWGTANISGAISDIVTKTAQQGQIRGWDKPKVDEEVQKNVGSVYAQVAAARIATGDTAGARALLDQAAKEKIPGTDLPILDAASHLRMLKEVESREDYDERHKLADEERADRAQERARRETARASGDVLIKSILKNPHSVTDDQIANAPGLTWQEKNEIANIARLHQNRDDAGELGGKHSPGFWDAYSGVTGSGPERITDPFQIYKRAGPKGDLSLPDAEKLVTIMNQRKTSEQRDDGDAASSAEFYKYAHRQIVPFQSNESEDAYHKWWQAAHEQDMKLKAEGKTAWQRYNEESPDYIGKGLKAAAPAPDDTLDAPQGGVPARSWVDFFRSFAPELPKHIDISTQDGLKAAVKAGQLTRAQGVEEARKRGWIAPVTAAPPMNQPTQALPAVPNAQ